jgi:hypothetical protein
VSLEPGGLPSSRLQRPILRRLDPWDVAAPCECRTDARGPRPTARCHRDHDGPTSRPRDNDPQLVHPPRSRRINPCCFRRKPPARPGPHAPDSGSAVGVARPTREHKEPRAPDPNQKHKPQSVHVQPRRADSAYWGRRTWGNGRTAQGRTQSGRTGRRGLRVRHRTAGVGTRLWTEFASVTLLRCLAGLPSGLILAPTGRYMELTYEPERNVISGVNPDRSRGWLPGLRRRVRRHPQPGSFARAARDRAAWRLARATLAARVLPRESGSEHDGLD